MSAFRPTSPTGPFLVKGIAVEPGEAPGIRQDVQEFKQNKDMWNLYLLGLWQFQLVPMEDQLSYFQIAGIHGLPYQAWPSNDANQEKFKKQNDGFCTHSSILFLTWHRPYLALFESVLREAMLFVANQFTEDEGRERYLVAAKAFRMPFWDWARPDVPVFPDVAIDSNRVRVKMPEKLTRVYEHLDKDANGLVEIPNPLYAYTFQKGAGESFKIQDLPTTTRHHSEGALTEQSPEDQKKALLDSISLYTREVNQDLPIEGNLCERLVYLIRSYTDFDQVSHNQWDPKRVPAEEQAGKPDRINGMGFGSFEDIHNTIHGLVGGSGKDGQNRTRTGHMSKVPIAAFDPIFWLHHANIDRILSIWQVLHASPSSPESWVTSKKSDQGSWVTRPGADEGINTPLAPFYKDRDSFWDSDGVRDTTIFGYAYPETKSWMFADADDHRRDVEHKLRALYPSGSLATMILASKAGDDQPEAILTRRAERLRRLGTLESSCTAITALSLVKTESPKPESLLASALPPVDIPLVELPDDRSLAHLAKGNTYLEWLVNIKAAKHAMSGEFLVHVFLGRVPAEESTVLYPASPYHVGTFFPLGQAEDTACGRCRRDQAAGATITGQIPLTIALAERYFAGDLDSLEEQDVIRYLQTNLHWEVVGKQGQRLCRQRNLVEGLLVGVASNRVTLPDGGGSESPHYSSDITIYPGVTTRQAGTSGRAEGTGVTEECKYFD